LQACRGIHYAATPSSMACMPLMVNEGTGCSAMSGDAWMAMQRRWRFRQKRKGCDSQTRSLVSHSNLSGMHFHPPACCYRILFIFSSCQRMLTRVHVSVVCLASLQTLEPCRSFAERITKNAAGQFLAWHAHYRHKRYNKSTQQLRRLKGTFVLPDFMQRKLRKAGF
jgi:ribosomal protein L35